MSDPVVVVGGGPGGATTAAFLAQNGVPVVLFEAERFPRHHVGESLQPATFQLLERHLGLGKEVAELGFARKYGALYVWGESRQPWSVLFDPRLELDLPALTEAALLAGDYERAWQVERSSFDKLLLDHARAAGVDVREGAEVTGVDFDGERAVGVTTAGGRLAARYVVDASGQRALVGRALGLVESLDDLRSTATYAYFDGAGGVPGPLGRHVQLIVTVPEGWAWFIPVSPTRTSVGVVVKARARMSLDSFMAQLRLAGLFRDEAAGASAWLPGGAVPPLEGARLANPESPLRFARDWSYALRRTTGPGWTAVGDAAAFVDPILSGGVDFAIRGGLNAAVGLLRVLDGADEAATMGEVATRQAREYRAYLRLARYWYGNNRSTESFFWQAHEELGQDSLSTPLRAFVYLTSGRYAADKSFRVFQQWQEEKMFRALGVDRRRLGEAMGKRRG